VHVTKVRCQQRERVVIFLYIYFVNSTPNIEVRRMLCHVDFINISRKRKVFIIVFKMKQIFVCFIQLHLHRLHLQRVYQDTSNFFTLCRVHRISKCIMLYIRYYIKLNSDRNSHGWSWKINIIMEIFLMCVQIYNVSPSECANSLLSIWWTLNILVYFFSVVHISASELHTSALLLNNACTLRYWIFKAF
jgi:hypothetical protein